jgi:hypothetical protein
MAGLDEDPPVVEGVNQAVVGQVHNQGSVAVVDTLSVDVKDQPVVEHVEDPKTEYDDDAEEEDNFGVRLPQYEEA